VRDKIIQVGHTLDIYETILVLRCIVV